MRLTIFCNSANRPDKKKVEEAVEFLRETLFASAVPSEVVKELAEENGIKARTLARAKSVLKVKSFNPTGKEWLMTLPDNEE